MLGGIVHYWALVPVEISFEAMGESKWIPVGADADSLVSVQPIFELETSGGLSDSSSRPKWPGAKRMGPMRRLLARFSRGQSRGGVGHNT